jgi:hypothetical protein
VVRTSALVFAALLIPMNAAAQRATDADKGAAIALFEEGRSLLEAGRLSEACEKLAASHALRPAAGTLLNLGECFERRHMTATAWITFQDAQSEARRAGDRDRAAEAARRIAVLEPKLARLVVRVPDRLRESATVRRDGADVPRAAWGTAVPVDPGTHVVAVSGPGIVAWSRSVDVPFGPNVVTVDVTADIEAPLHPAPTQPTTNVTRTFAWLGAGASLVVLGAGTAFAIRAQGRWDDARVECPEGGACSAEGVRLGESAGASADVATALFVTGGILAAASIVLFVVSPRSASAARASSLVVRF